MADQPLLYYITDRKAFAGDEHGRRHSLLEKIEEAASCGVDYIQLREKDLPARELELLACEAVRAVRRSSTLGIGNRKPGTTLLINSRTDVALAAGADGVHLRSNDVSSSDVRAVWLRTDGSSVGSVRSLDDKPPLTPVIGISCHSVDEVTRAAAEGADFTVFGPVFEKKDSAGSRAVGLAMLQAACAVRIPVLALGGVTIENAQFCLEAGAAGIAAIRLFQENDIASVVRTIRG
jgi:thiamine-phosphate pyrophosphorylase